ncbi:MAG TPA: SPW repeat protein [Xanthobacteraceae bacterium]|nr:SPW repeat protein [Xanthobacteraceae bacterium]
MLAQRYRTAALIDVINLLLGMLLFFAPWMFGFVSTVASENAWLSGALISLLATAAIIAFDAREQRLNLLVGLWVAVSPWLLGFHAEMHIHFIVGLLLVALVLFELWLNVEVEDGEATADHDTPGSSAVRPAFVAPSEQESRDCVEPKIAAIPLRHAPRSIPAAVEERAA